MVKRKDGRWQQAVTMTIRGQRVVKTFYGRTKSDVYRAIAEFEDKQASAANFNEIADEWWGEHEPTLAESTKPSYKRAYLRAVEYFKDTPINELNVQSISRYMNSIIAKYKMSQKTATSHLSIVSLIITYACTQGYANANPCQFVKLPKLKSNKRHMPCSNDIEAIKKDHSSLGGQLAYWALYTGMRRGELIALTYDDIDLEHRLIRVNKSADVTHNAPVLKSTKTETGERAIPILDTLLPEIKKGRGYVFTYKGEPLTSSRFRDMWEAYQKQTGVSCSIHQLRHAFATMLCEANVPIKDAQAMLGHAQASTTQDVYADIRKERQKQFPEMYGKLDIK